MKVSQVVRAVKFDLEIGDWKSGHIPRAVFPLSKVKPKNYKYGPEYKWRVVSFETSQGKFRLLILINEVKLIFRASLAVETENGDLAVICQHEYHQSEPGWHCHVTFAPIEGLPSGVFRNHLEKWPKFRNSNVQKSVVIHASSALSIAAERFRFRAQGDLL